VINPTVSGQTGTAAVVTFMIRGRNRNETAGNITGGFQLQNAAGTVNSTPATHMIQTVWTPPLEGTFEIALRNPVRPIAGQAAYIDFHLTENPGFANMELWIDIPTGGLAVGANEASVIFGTPITNAVSASLAEPLMLGYSFIDRRVRVSISNANNFMGISNPSLPVSDTNQPLFTIRIPVAPQNMSDGDPDIVIPIPLPNNVSQMFHNAAGPSRPTNNIGTFVDFNVPQAGDTGRQDLEVILRYDAPIVVGETRGDINGDGRLTGRDVTLIARFIASGHNHAAPPTGMWGGNAEEVWTPTAANAGCFTGPVDGRSLTRLMRFLLGHYNNLCTVGIACEACN
jgi:hypothetical protein